MTTEQMDWLDDERAGRHDTASRRAEQMAKVRTWGMSGVPEILYGDPSEEELAAAQERGGHNGVLIVPEEMRDPHFGHEYDHYTEVSRAMCAGGNHDAAVMADRDAVRVKIRAENEAHIRKVYDVEESDVSAAAVELLRKAIRAFPVSWDMDGVRFVEFRKEIDADYARDAETLIVQLIPEFHCEICGSDTHDALGHSGEPVTTENADDYVTMAEEHIDDRLRRQWLNGYMMGFREGFERAGWLDR